MKNFLKREINSEFQFESSLLEEAYTGMEELGLLKKIEDDDD